MNTAEQFSPHRTRRGEHELRTYNSVFVTVFPAGVNDVNGNKALAIYPNPNNGNFRIKGLVTNEPVSFAVKNVLGQIVYSKDIPEARTAIDEEVLLPHSIPAGIYLLDIKQGNSRDVIKFRVAH